MTTPSPSILSDVRAANKPRVEPKWTRRNDEWVQVLCEIQRGPGGLSDRPVTSTINAGAKP